MKRRRKPIVKKSLEGKVLGNRRVKTREEGGSDDEEEQRQERKAGQMMRGRSPTINHDMGGRGSDGK